MKWRKFSDKKPKDNSELIIRAYSYRKFPQAERISFSSNILWMNGSIALCQEYYEWLDEESDECPCCGKVK